VPSPPHEGGDEDGIHDTIRVFAIPADKNSVLIRVENIADECSNPG